LAVYFLALFIPLLTGAVVYLLQIREVEQEILDARADTLELNKQIVESAILLIEDMVTEIRQDDDLVELGNLDDPLGNNAVLRVAEAYRQSRLSLPTPDYLLDLQVYLRRPDVLLSLTDVFFDPAIYYRYFFHLDDLSYTRWRELIRTRSYVHQRLSLDRVTLRGSDHEVITLTSSLPYSPRLSAVGRVMAYIDKEAVENLLRTYLAGEDGFAFIRLPDGRILAEAGRSGGSAEFPLHLGSTTGGVYFTKINDREYAISHIRSEANQWLYVSGTPVEVFFAQSRRIRVVFIALALLILLVGLPIAVFQTFGLSRPIAQTSEVLKHGVVLSESVSSNPFTFISDSVDELIKRDRSLRELLAEQKPLVRSVVLERLFRGEFHSESEAQAFLDHFEIPVRSGRSLVLCVVIEGYFDVVTPEILNEFTVKAALIRDELSRLLPAASLMHNVSHNAIGVLIFVDDEEQEIESGVPVESVVDTLSSRLRAARDVRCTVAVGGFCRSLTGIARAIQVAIQSAEHAEPGGVATEAAWKNGDSMYYYPTEVELRLVKTVRAGNQSEVAAIAEKIEEENLNKRTLSRENQRRLYQELDATRLKVGNAGCDDARFSIDTGGSTEERVRALLRYFQAVAAHRATTDSIAGRLKEPIERFVRENALHPEMGLKLLAMQFNLSEVYVSRLFKEQFGENFHSFVEGLRMDQAVRLLRTSALNVEEIADQVGYQSANTFRRVFKRRFGVSPSNYKA
jgi:AraC-like DNA-binding protein